MLRILIAPAVTLTVLLAACGGNGKADTVDPQPTATRTAAPSATAAASNPSAQSPTPTPETVPTSDKLTKALLDVKDLPSGWSVTTSDSSNSEQTQLCDTQPVDNLVPPTGKAEVMFQQSDFGPFLVQVLLSYKGNDAQKAMDAIAKGMKSCNEWVQTAKDGTTTTYKVSALSFPKIADETFAARASTSDVRLFGTMQIDFVFVRRANIVSLYGYIALGPTAAAPSPLESLVRKADDKLKNPLAGH